MPRKITKFETKKVNTVLIEVKYFYCQLINNVVEANCTVMVDVTIKQ